jgi:ubiquinone/menaquinone biosynthesis C-methylase UbiE
VEVLVPTEARTANEQFHLDELGAALDSGNPCHIAPPPQPVSKTILDIGCGAGQTLIASYPDRVSYGIDIDAEALGLGGRLTKRVRFSLGRAEALPYADAQFDMVISRVALPYTNFQRSFKEIRRVLKPGGELWITLHSFSLVTRNLDLGRLRTYLSFAFVLTNSLLFHVCQRQFSVFGRCESFQTQRGIRRALEQNGFRAIEIKQGRHFLVQARAPGSTPMPRETPAGIGKTAGKGPAVGSEAA